LRVLADRQEGRVVSFTQPADRIKVELIYLPKMSKAMFCAPLSRKEVMHFAQLFYFSKQKYKRQQM